MSINKYKKTDISTASKEQILLLLYRNSISSLKQSMTENPLFSKKESLLKAYNIVMELKSSLDRSQNKDLINQLDDLYNFILIQIEKANMKNDYSGINTAIDILTNLYTAWNTIIK